MTENRDIMEDMVNSIYYDKKEERFLSIIKSQQRMIESQQKYSRIATKREKGNRFPRGRSRLCQCKRVRCGIK